MNRSALFMLLVGALLYYGFARYRGILAGPPWAPMGAVTNGKRAAGS